MEMHPQGLKVILYNVSNNDVHKTKFLGVEFSILDQH